jgi:hypothetical protein
VILEESIDQYEIHSGESPVLEDFDGLPAEIRAGLLSFTRESDGEIEIADPRGMVQFILDHAEAYPVLLKAISVDKEALTRHIEATGEVPPGVKAIRVRTTPGSNVTRLDILHGPTTVPPDLR